jgi:hypothetical protein
MSIRAEDRLQTIE